MALAGESGLVLGHIMSILRAMIACAAFALTGAADAPQLVALSHLEPGQWTLRALDGRMSPRSICLGDVRVLLQLQHPGASCSRFIIANDPSMTIVHYTCPGAGHGRTEVRVETPRLMQIESQGIAANTPFDWTLEARHTGPCAPAMPVTHN